MSYAAPCTGTWARLSHFEPLQVGRTGRQGMWCMTATWFDSSGYARFSFCFVLAHTISYHLIPSHTISYHLKQGMYHFLMSTVVHLACIVYVVLYTLHKTVCTITY